MWLLGTVPLPVIRRFCLRPIRGPSAVVSGGSPRSLRRPAGPLRDVRSLLPSAGGGVIRLTAMNGSLQALEVIGMEVVLNAVKEPALSA